MSPSLLSICFCLFKNKYINIGIISLVSHSQQFQACTGKSFLNVPIGKGMPTIATYLKKYWEKLVWKVLMTRFSTGWVAVTAGRGMEVDLRAYTPGARGCSLREPAFLPFAVNRRGHRMRKSAAYKLRQYKFKERWGVKSSFKQRVKDFKNQDSCIKFLAVPCCDIWL